MAPIHSPLHSGGETGVLPRSGSNRVRPGAECSIHLVQLYIQTCLMRFIPISIGLILAHRFGYLRNLPYWHLTGNDTGAVRRATVLGFVSFIDLLESKRTSCVVESDSSSMEAFNFYFPVVTRLVKTACGAIYNVLSTPRPRF